MTTPRLERSQELEPSAAAESAAAESAAASAADAAGTQENRSAGPRGKMAVESARGAQEQIQKEQRHKHTPQHHRDDRKATDRGRKPP